MRSVAVNEQKAVVIWSWGADQVFSVESESADPLRSLSSSLVHSAWCACVVHGRKRGPVAAAAVGSGGGSIPPRQEL